MTFDSEVDGGGCVLSLGEIEEQLKETREELSRVSEEKEELAQRCHQLDSQVRKRMPIFRS